MTEQIKNQIPILYNTLKSSRLVAKQLGVSQSYVMKQLKLQMIDTVRKDCLSEEQQQKVIELYLKGQGSRELGKMFNVSKTKILEIIKHLDYRNNNKQYDLNRTKFETIETEEDAYFLGFMFADGYNNESEFQITLQLHKKDGCIIEKFKEYFETNRPIYNKKNVHLALSINDKNISINLAKHGCVQAKTFILTFPIVPKHLEHHFIRGYFDGDGSIFSSVVSFVGTIEFLTELNERFFEKYHLNVSTIRDRYPERKTNIREFRYIGLNKVAAMYDYMYKDATLYLDRKKQRFMSKLKMQC